MTAEPLNLGAGRRRGEPVLFLAAGSTLLAFAAWYWSLSHGGIARMGAMHELQASSRLMLAAPMLVESVTGRDRPDPVGIALIQRRRRQPRQESAAASAAARQRRS